MTPRSPIQHPKTTTISRRLRSRADQDLSVQPPELPQVRSLRSRRAATLSSNSHISVNYQLEEATPLWDPAGVDDSFTRSNSSHPSGLATSHPSGLDQNPTPDLLLSQTLDHLPPYHSPQGSPTELVPLSNHPHSDHFEVPHTSGSNLLPSPLPSVSGSHSAVDYGHLRLSPDPDLSQDHQVEYQDMSQLDFMMPAQYGSLDHHYQHHPNLDTPNYPPMQQTYSDTRASQPPTSNYGSSYTSAPTLQNGNPPRRSTELPALSAYQSSSVPRSPYQQSLGPMRASPTPIAYPPSSSESSPMLSSAPHSYPYPAIHANLPGQSIGALGSNSSSYPAPPIYPPTSYEMSGYGTLPPTMYPASSTAGPYQSYDSPAGLASTNGAGSGLPSSPGGGAGVRVINSRPKPQCWEHGCNGRQFSTFSNLLRHQREKSGTAAKSYCPKCGAEFTRTTARNGHMAHDKCKPRRASDESR